MGCQVAQMNQAYGQLSEYLVMMQLRTILVSCGDQA